jgi:hypothetical protein
MATANQQAIPTNLKTLRNVTATPAKNSVILRWGPPLDTIKLVRFQYRWRLSGTTGTSTLPYISTDKNSVVVENLENGTAYDFQISAVYFEKGILSSGPISAVYGIKPIAE